MGRHAAALLTVAALLMGVPSAAATIKLTHKEYTPTFSASLKDAYKGMEIYFYAFTNDADDTGLWTYESETTKTNYKIQDNRLNYYLLYCFQEAARSLGMIVYEAANEDPDLRKLDLVFTSWSHERFRCRISVYRGTTKRVNKSYNVEFERARSLDPGGLKQRAYDSVTKVFTTILEDEEVRQALLGPPPKR